MLIGFVFVFFALLAVVYELHILIDRMIEIGTIVEYYNRRDLRASGILKEDDEDSFDGEFVTKNHPSWPQVVLGIIGASIVTLVSFKFVFGVLK
jgi:hypothetical protein